MKGEAGYNYLYRINCGGDDYTDSFDQLWLQDNTNYSHSWAENFKELNPYLASQRTTNDPIRGTRDWTLFQHFRFGRHQLEYRFLWQTEHIVLNYISQSLGMVRAEALLPTVKDCAYSMLP